MKYMVLIVACFMALAAGSLLVVWLTDRPKPRLAEQWQAESWMQEDETLARHPPDRILCLTDLPPLEPAPTPDEVAAAIQKSREAGCNGAVLSHSWPSLEPRAGELTLEELKGAVIANEGRVLYLGIQILNTTVKDLPTDLTKTEFDDPSMIERFKQLLDGLAPLLKHRVRYLSIGNESDIYFSMHPREIEPYRVFLEAAREHARTLSPNLTVGTTLTDAGAMKPEMQSLIRNMDAHFLTYYHGQHGMEGSFKDTAETRTAIVALAETLDERPILFQEIGFPADEKISSVEKQAEFVGGVFDAWDELGSRRVPLMNYFMMYDFPTAVVQEQVNYYGVTEGAESLVLFLSSLGLHTIDGLPRPAWEVFERRAGAMMKQ